MKTLLPLLKLSAVNISAINWRKSLLCFFFPSLLINIAMAGPVNENDHHTTVAGTVAGSYTVGTGGDYLTLTAAVNAYNSFTLTGPVTFCLISSTYSAGETFPIVIMRNTTASATNTLTIKPAVGVTASVSGTINSDAMFKVLGSYVTIDGSNNGTNSRNLTFTNNGSTSARTIMFGSTGSFPVVNSTLKNCNVLGGNSTSNAVVLCDGAAVNSPGYFNNITIENNLVNKAFYGIYCNAIVSAGNGSGLLIQNNDLTSSGTSAIQFAGIMVQGVDGVTVSYNSIGNFISTDATTDCGIWLSTGTKNAIILGNTITNLTYTGGAGYGSRGIYVSTGVTSANIKLSGNMISNITGDGDDYTNSGVTLNNPHGILMVGPQTGLQIYNNSICMGAVTGFTNTLNKANAMAACIRIYGSGTADIRNNILVNNLGLNGATGYGTVGLMASNSTSQFTSLNYNDYVINPAGSGVKAFGMIGTTAYGSLAAWKTITGKDVASINVTPVFVSSTDLHLVPASNPLLNNAALPIAGNNDNDVDNATRNPQTPDIGCDEFVEPNKAWWIGKVSTAWTTASNWEANAIPGATTDVTINGGYTFMPTISTTQAINSLLLSAPGTPPVITINGGNLQINGNITKTGGTIDATNGTIEMNGSTAQYIPAGLFVNNDLKDLIIGNSDAVTGVSLTSALNIYRSVSFSATGLKLTTNDFLTLKSTIAETAWVGDVTGKTISGNVTVERYIPTVTPAPGVHGKSWQLLSVPVSGSQTVNAAWQEGAITANANPNSGYGIQITGEMAGALGLGFDVYTPAGPSMKTFNALTGGYNGIANTNTLPIANQKGYMVFIRGDRSITAYNQAPVPTVLRAKGKLYTTGADLPPATNVLADKFESVGNPYASAINFTAITRTGATDNTYYVWDPLLAGTGYGGFQTISATALWVPSPGGTANYPTGVPVTSIQSGQAFFVHATGAAGTVSFTEAAKITGSKNIFRNTNTNSTDNQFLRVLLYNGIDSTAGVADGNTIAFSNDYSNDYTGDDALKFASNTASIGVSGNGRLLAVEARSLPSNNDTIFYSIANLRRQAYQLKLMPENLQFGNLIAYFEDGFLHTSTALSFTDNTTIDFTVTDDFASAAAGRFYIVFKQLLITPVTFTNISAIRTSENAINVNWDVDNEINIENYEVQRSKDGRNFDKINTTTARTTNGGRSSYTYPDQSPFQGDNFYRIRSKGRDGQYQYSAVVKVAGLKQASLISIYPNPVVDKKLSIAFNNQPEGTCKIELRNVVGQVIYSDKVMVNSSNMVKTISLDRAIAAGTYQLVIIAENGSKRVEQLFIQ
ncbi:MAG: T9SS type A sorting domain-containing protein [Ferruginibacter sp.]